jgi:tetratricopeptide (TPR) repeat protein
LALVAVALAGAQPARAETRLAPAAARTLAIQLAQEGELAAARALALALLARDPGDVTALILLSRVERDLGDHAAAAAAGRRAFRLAGTGEERFAAALATAQALSSDGRRTAAQLWLRRAAHVAPDARLRAVAIRDFRYVRARNPMSVELSFGLAPSDNVNGGPTSTTLVIGGVEFVNPDAVPLSGITASVGADLGYTWDLAPATELRAGLSLSSSAVALSADARRRVPSARGSDYGGAGAALSLAFVHTPAGGRLRLGLEAEAGREWSAGAPLMDSLRLTASAEAALGPATRAAVRVAAEHQERLDHALRSADVLTFGARLTHALAGGGALDLDLVLGATDSRSAAIAHRAAGLDLGWTLARPVAGAETTLFASVAIRDFERPLFTADPREDLATGLGLRMVFRGLDVMGFVPRLELDARRNRSSVALYDTRAVALHLGIESSF